MRICFVSREPSGPIRDASLELLMQALVRAGHAVHLLTSSTASDAALALDGVTVHRVSIEGGVASLPGFGSDASRYAWAVQEALDALHRAHRFDWIDLPVSGGAGAFVLGAKRFSGGYRDAVLMVRLAPLSREVRELNRSFALDVSLLELDHLERSSLRHADVVRARSRTELEHARGGVEGLAPAVVVPLPVAPEVFHRLDESRPSRAMPTVRYEGPLDRRSGLETLVSAACALLERGHRLHVELVGADTCTGPFGRPYVWWLKRQLPPQWRGHFAFVTEPRSLAHASAPATVSCFPWFGAPDPEACLQALSRGSAVVHSDALEPESLAGEGASCAFPRGDAEALAACLEQVLTSAELRARMGRTAREQTAARHEPSQLVRQLERVVAEHSGKASAPTDPPVRASRSTPQVSIVVPFFNLHAHLPETLASIDAQTFSDFEVIIVDDGSTAPESLSLLTSLEREGRQIVRKPNGGLSSARNAGLAVARGRWILPLDADDLIAPTFLERTVAVLVREPSLAYATTLVSRFVETPEVPTGVYVPWGLERDALPLTNVASTCTALLPREVLEHAGGYDTWLTSFEDWDLYCTLAERGLTGAVVPEFLFHYRSRPDSLVHTEVLERRNALMAYLIAKHPRLAEHPDLSLRAMLGEHFAELQDLPLRHRVVDAVNDRLKRLPWVQPLLKRGRDLARRARKQR